MSRGFAHLRRQSSSTRLTLGRPSPKFELQWLSLGLSSTQSECRSATLWGTVLCYRLLGPRLRSPPRIIGTPSGAWWTRGTDCPMSIQGLELGSLCWASQLARLEWMLECGPVDKNMIDSIEIWDLELHTVPWKFQRTWDRNGKGSSSGASD